MNLSQLAINVRNIIGHEDSYRVSTDTTVVIFDYHHTRIDLTDLAKLSAALDGSGWDVTVRAIRESETPYIRFTFIR